MWIFFGLKPDGLVRGGPDDVGPMYQFGQFLGVSGRIL